MLLLLLAACPGTDTLTWHEDTHPIVAARCESCHQEGGSAPIPLTTYDEVALNGPLMEVYIEEGTMPPWPPDSTCRAYEHDASLPEDDKATLLTWLRAGAPEGNPKHAVEVTVPEPESLDPDLVLTLPSYLPEAGTDDYRCLLVDWPEQGDTYVTGFEVLPDQAKLVHHVIAYIVEPEQVAPFEAADGADGKPGYPCFGSGNPPGFEGGLGELRWLAAWAPGVRSNTFPEGTGVAMRPGSKLAMQMHFNTLHAPAVADQSSLAVTLASQVERPAALVPFTSPVWVTGEVPMTIPAGEPEVTHRYNAAVDRWWWDFVVRSGVPLQEGDQIRIHSAALHMHLLGTTSSMQVERPSGDRACLLEIPEWDFNWQGSYVFEEPVLVGKEDELRLSCTWDNSALNQPEVDGVRQEPVDVAWGDGTRDEMCLGLMFVTRAQ